MKKLAVLGLVFMAVCACSPQKETTGTGKPAAFDRWYVGHYSPALERTNEYYRSMNSQGVINWNHYFTRNRYSTVIGSYISYNPSVDYGLEVNRRLYWYFRFIEENFRIRL
jgi:hypothetical protein